jgi:diacylglycerol kinase (ATP)
MKKVQIIHNPTAGDGEHSREELISMVEEKGYAVRYSSTDEDNWRDFHSNEMDAILVAGGDGTIKKLAKVMLDKLPGSQLPIRLLPLGTANNIARTLKIPRHKGPSLADFEGEIDRFDCGKITGLPEETYFLESVGFGIFPELIAKMDKNNGSKETTSEKLQRGLEVLLEIVKNFKAQKAKIKVEGITIKGSFLLVELMNIPYLGPNLKLAPHVEQGDGYFNLVIIPEERRADLEDYLEKLINDRGEKVELEKFIKYLRVRKVTMKCKGAAVHVDDYLVKDYSGKSFELEIIPGALKFLQ